MKNEPFSVLMVTHALEKPARLNSCLKSCYEQTFRADEIVLILDGSIGSELKIIIDSWKKKLAIKVFEKEKLGLAKCLRFGLTMVEHDLVLRVDSDDRSLENRFEIQINTLLTENVSITSAPIEEIWEDGIPRVRSVPKGLINKNNIFSFFRSSSKNFINFFFCHFFFCTKNKFY